MPESLSSQEMVAIARDCQIRFRSQFVAIERRLGVEVAVHNIKMPTYDEPFYYTQHRSLQAFGDRELQRVFGKKAQASGNWVQYAHSLPIYFHVEPRWKHEADAEIMRRLQGKAAHYDNLPHVEHDHVFAFYKHIRYDYKRKRFLKDGEDFKL
jgi:hypothetical protein